MKNNKLFKFIIILLIAIIILIIFRFNRNDKVYNYKEIDSYVFDADQYINTTLNDHKRENNFININSLRGLEDNSLIIAKVKLIDYEQDYCDITTSNLIVNEIYKGKDLVKTKDNIKVYENLNFKIMFDPQFNYIQLNSLYLPMRTETEYLVFLRKEENRAYYSYVSEYYGRFNTIGTKIKTDSEEIDTYYKIDNEYDMLYFKYKDENNQSESNDNAKENYKLYNSIIGIHNYIEEEALNKYIKGGKNND
ncbi:MAG: hypothetical protein RR659_05195 [Bacilli bacterium]